MAPEYLEDESLENEIDFSDLEKKYAVNPDDGFETFIVVDGAPEVPEAKVPALTKVLKKMFSTVGTISSEGFQMPIENGKTKGFIFIEYQTKDQAAAAVRTYNNKKLDAKHTLLVNKLSDIERYGFEGNVQDEYKEPEIEPFAPREHLRSWLTDPQGRDQFVMHRGDDVGIFWNRKSDGPELVVNRQHWTETYVRWSPKGTFLASIHRQGIQTWGGDTWSRLGRFIHPGVRLIDFSPNENFLVSWSPEPIVIPDERDPARAHFPFKEQDAGNSVVIWDVKTVLPLRSFPMIANTDKDKKVVWPMFKWSSDDKYFARSTPGEQLSVYEAPSMGLVDKKSIKIPGIVDFEFAPGQIKLEGRKQTNGEHVLCYWTPEISNQSARVSIMTVPSKEIIRTRNLFNVSDCRLHWQDQGKFLCVKVDRHTKTKKSTFTNLEFFRLTEKDIPVEVVELKETVVNFAWEPKRDRFVIISQDNSPGAAAAAPVANRNIVSFYALEHGKGIQKSWKLLKLLDKKSSNSIYWSPKGRFVITANVGSSSCELEFWDFDHEGLEKREDVSESSVNLIQVGTSEHYGMTDLEWDPSGRYVASSSSFWRHTIENGYKVWDFRGSLIREEAIDKFKSFLWRPRPVSPLTKEQKKQINKNLKSYSRRFDEEDAMEASEASRELILKRRKALADWKQWREAMDSILHELGLSTETEIFEAEDDADEVIEEIREEVLEEREEVVE